MYCDDIQYLCCPVTSQPLELAGVTETAEDGEILTGELRATGSGQVYRITNGIPRFVLDKNYNKTWDYKWTELDGGKGYNYKVADKTDLAYQIHDIFDRNNHGGKAYLHMRDRLVLDLGCGVGQNTWRMLQEYGPSKVVSMDLTRGVDIFRKIMLERFPQFKQRILMVQGNVFQMPFRDETFDYILSMGVLHHTGNTREAIRQAGRVLRYGGQINFWIYCAEPIPYSAREPGRTGFITTRKVLHLLIMNGIIQKWINLFRRLPHDRAVAIVRMFSSDFWYKLNMRRVPVVRSLAQLIFPVVQYPDFGYRLINHYDGWINTWDDSWNESEIFPTLRAADIVIQDIAEWRLGIWGCKVKDFYA